MVCVLALLLVSGCASTSFKGRFQLNDQLADTRALEAKSDSMSWEDAKDIVVISDLKSQGIEVKDGKAILPKDFDYEVIGGVYTNTNGEMCPIGNIHSTPFYFYPYSEDEGMRNVYCHIQTPLMWVTLGIWSLVPTFYPCKFIDTNKDDDIANRKIRIANTLKKAAKALGGTHLLFLGQEPLVFESINTGIYAPRGGSFAFASSSVSRTELAWARGWGLVLKKKSSTAQK